MAVELNHTIVPARDPRVSTQFLADILGLPRRGAYFRDPNGHLMEILTQTSGEPT
jgi:catechol 2,3-dioxygenase-like lactoylglutathione lyase family enzyme